MKRLSLAMVLCVGVSTAVADSPPVPVVGFECEPAKDRLTVTYDIFEEDKVSAELQAKAGRSWNPWDLVTYKDPGDGNNYVASTEVVRKSCKLSSGNYTVTISGAPGNDRIGGHCGAAMTADLQVLQGAAVIYPRKKFDNSCHDGDFSHIIHAVTISGRLKEPSITYLDIWSERMKSESGLKQ